MINTSLRQKQNKTKNNIIISFKPQKHDLYNVFSLRYAEPRLGGDLDLALFLPTLFFFHYF